METTRRNFLRTAGAAGVVAMAGARAERADAAEDAKRDGAGAAPRGLTLCNIRTEGGTSLGVRTKAGVLDVGRAARGRKLSVPATTDDVIAGVGLSGLRQLVAEAESGKKSAPVIPESAVRFGPAVTRPQKIFCMGLNYRKHIEEVKAKMPTAPTFFNKFSNALLGHGGTVPLPVKAAQKFDYEAELVVVVGRRMRDVESANALAHVFGYCTGNDFTARDLQNRTTQWMLGKTCDGFAPLGPWLVGADVVGDPQNLKIECRVNGEVRQSSNTSDMIYSCADLLADASRAMTLEPGDILFTGTPEGVIFGKPPEQQVWLKPGDKIVTEIEKLGRLEFDLGTRVAS